MWGSSAGSMRYDNLLKEVYTAPGSDGERAYISHVREHKFASSFPDTYEVDVPLGTFCTSSPVDITDDDGETESYDYFEVQVAYDGDEASIESFKARRVEPRWWGLAEPEREWEELDTELLSDEYLANVVQDRFEPDTNAPSDNDTYR